MSDIYKQLDKNQSRLVEPRTSDGFTKPIENQTSNIEEKLNHSPNQTITNLDSDVVPNYLVQTSKSKLLTLEVEVRAKIDRILFDNPEISWDTLIESALLTCLNNENTKNKVIKTAKERLTARRKTAVHKRSKTMSQRYT